MKGLLISVVALCTLASVAAARVSEESNRQGKGEWVGFSQLSRLPSSIEVCKNIVASSLHFLQ